MTPPPTSQGPPTGQAPGHSGHSQPAPWLQEQQESGGYWGTGVKGTGQRVSGERPRPGKHTHPSERAVCVAEPSSGAEVGGVQGPAWPGLHGGPKAEVPEPDPEAARASEPLPPPQARA